MRFYLLYRNHGLYDPVLDDTELTYVPISQEEYEGSNLQQVNCYLNDEGKLDLKQNNGEDIDAAQFARETIKYTLEDEIRLQLKDAFQNINIEELPPTARFKLPISEDYDPEGKKISKLQRFYDKNILSVDLTKVSEQIRQEVNKVAKNVEEMRQEIGGENIITQNEMTKEVYKNSEKNKEDIGLKTIQEMASQVVDSSINKAVEVAAEMKQNLNVSSDEKQFKQTKIKSDTIKESTFSKTISFEESKLKERQNKFDKKYTQKQVNNSKSSSLLDKKETKKVSFSDIVQEEEITEVNEMKKIEIGANTEMGSTLTAEKRKILTKQDIEEAIAPGTVRDRAAIFKKYNIMEDVVKKSDNKYEKSASKDRKLAISDTARMQNIKMAQRRVYNIGVHTIENIRRKQYSKFSQILLRTFLSKFTNVLITISKFTTVKPNQYFLDLKPGKTFTREKTLEHQEFQRRDGELIIKSKLSGAKIAQIEGMKPVELTKKMDIVISELQRKSGIEEQLNKEEISQEYMKSKIEDDIKRDYSESQSNINEDFYQNNSYKHDTNYENTNDTNYGNKKFNTFETTKTQTMEIREIKTEKHTSEFKRSKIESNNYKKEENQNENITKTDTENKERILTTDDGKIIYIAIVEAHVYTNKDAIFEIHLRRLSENENIIEKTEVSEQRDETETIDKRKLYAEFDACRKLSLASTVLIEPEEEYSTEFKSRPVKYIRSATDLEHVAKKMAVQNITQVIEPLLKLEAHKYGSSKHAYTTIEMPIRRTAETSDITSEEKQMYFQAQVFVQQKSYMSLEKPDKPIVEIKEIFVDEDETGIIEESKIIVEEPQPTIEVPVKSIAQTSEVLINEEQIKVIEIIEPIPSKPLPTIDIAAKSVALTSEVLIAEADLKFFDKPEAVSKTSSASIQKSSLAVAETTTTSSEFNSEYLNINKARRESANIKMGEHTATEVSQISLEELIHEKIKDKSITEQESCVIVEKTTVLPVAESLIILPEETSNELSVAKVINQQANIDMEQMKATEILTVAIEEPKHENFEVPKINEKLPQTLLESCVLTTAQTLAVIPEGPKDKNLETPNVVIRQTKPLIEIPLLTAAESIITLPGGPKEESLKINEITSVQPSIDFEEFKAASVIIISPEEPTGDSFDIPKVTEKEPQISVEGPLHTVAEMFTVIPASSIEDNLDIIKPQEKKIKTNYNELSSVETITVVPDEPKVNDFDIPKVTEKIPQTSMEGPLYTVAQIITIIPDGPIDESFNVKLPEAEKIQVKYYELNPVEATMILPEESIKDDLHLPKISVKHPQITTQETNLNIAEIFTVIPEEAKDEVFEVSKVSTKKARIDIQEQKAAETKIISLEERANENLIIPEVKNRTAKVSTVEDMVTAKAKAPKLAIVDVSNEKRFEEIELNYTVELPKEEDEKVQEVFAEITITKQQTPPAEIFAEFEFNERKIDVASDVSESIKLMNRHDYKQESMDVSYSHTIKEEIKRIMKSWRYEAEFIRSGSSSPITPLIEEYMFRLQCPLLRRYLEEVFEEVTLKLKSKIQKTTVQNFDACLTLILQDIAMSRESEEVDIALESMKYVSSTDMSVQNIDSQSLSTSIETSASSKSQSLHTGVAIASAATKHTIETGIDVNMLTVEQESLAEAKLSAAKKSSSLRAKAAKFESLQSKSSKLQSVEASYSQAVESETTFVGQSLEANMGVSMQNTNFAVSQNQEKDLRTAVFAAEQSEQSSALSIEEISDEESLKAMASSFSKAKSVAADKKLSLRTDMTMESDEVTYESPLSPPTVPQTPLVDEYVFRLEIPLPKESKFVPRDCSYSPDSIDDDIILKNGLIPHIKTKIYRILYSPPLPTPPTSPDRVIPIYGSGIKSSDKKDPNSSLFKFLS